MLSFFVCEVSWCFFFLLIYTISINILCISWEEHSLIESNQQIRDFYKTVAFENQTHCETLYSKIFISANYSFNIIQIAVVNA